MRGFRADTQVRRYEMISPYGRLPGNNPVSKPQGRAYIRHAPSNEQIVNPCALPTLVRFGFGDSVDPLLAA